jgi:uncharacterized protein (DUF58 family)
MKPVGFIAAARRSAEGVFPFSLRGLLVTILSAAMLAEGVLRADLAALFWGSSFLLYAAYAIVASHLLRLSLRRRHAADPDSLSIVLPSAGIAPDESAEAALSARLPRAFPPGFAVRFSLPLTWQERSVGSVAARLERGVTRRSIAFTVPRRGVYASEEAILEGRDILGFTRNRLRIPLRESVTVHPFLRTAEGLALHMEQADDSALFARRRRRSEELLETRKYYPGDDVRRLNWKVFAHLNELFLRVGEEVPPPESRILFVLDCSANSLLPRSGSADYLDGLVEACASLMVALMSRRVDVMLSLPGVRECRSFSDESRSALLASLARTWWTTEEWAPELPGRQRLHVAVFSTPGSPGLRGIMTTIHARGWSASLFIKGMDPEPPIRPRGLKELFFLSEGGGDDAPSGAQVGRRERSALSEALSSDLTAYRGPAWKVRDAVQI